MQLHLELECQFCKEETGTLQYQVAVVRPAGGLPALLQGSLCQEVPHKGMFSSPSSSASLPFSPAHLPPPLAATPAGEHPPKVSRRAMQAARPGEATTCSGCF